MYEKNDWKLKAENIAYEFFKSKKNSNCLLDLEKLLLSSNEQCVLSVIPVVLDVFSKIFSMDILNSSVEDETKNVYRVWILNRYEDFVSHLLSYLSSCNNTDIQVSTLNTLMSLVKVEGGSPRKDENENQYFPLHLFKRIVSALASDILNQHHLIKIFQDYTKYHDVKLYLLKSIQTIVQESEKVSEVFLQNCFFLLYSMKYPKPLDSAESAEVFAYRSDPQQPFKLKEKMFRKLFSDVWKFLLSFEFSSEFLQKALAVFNDNILPHLQNPCLMTDFLTNAYNKGGVLSLLALRGLFYLMDKYNLEYSEFFTKLYALLDKNIINGKFSSMFFELANLFLSSTHLPAHIVAAFAKKLCRLSLISSAVNILKILCLVSNLLANHPSLGILIHQTNENVEYDEDPYNWNATDPAESNAVKSSLWEIKVLHSHVNPFVSIKAKKLTASYPKLSTDILNISNSSLQDLYKKFRKRKFTEVALAVNVPPGKRKKREINT